MPPRIVVIVRPRGIVRVERSSLFGLLAVNPVVIVFVRTVVSHLPAPDDEHTVNVAVFAAGDVSVQLGQYLGVKSDGGWRSCRPAFGRPLILRHHAGSEENYDE